MDIPAVVNTRTIQVVIADETGLGTVQEWGVVQLEEALSASRMGLVFVDEVTYDQRIIRVKTNINLKLLFEKRVSKYIYLGVIFDYLSDEVFKTFAPACKLTGPTNSTNLATTCEVVGHRVEMFLLENLEIGVVYNLEITDMPNPDFGFCEPIPLRVIISNALKSKTLLASSPFINNISKEPFKNKENTKILDFMGGNL